MADFRKVEPVDLREALRIDIAVDLRCFREPVEDKVPREGLEPSHPCGNRILSPPGPMLVRVGRRWFPLVGVGLRWSRIGHELVGVGVRWRELVCVGHNRGHSFRSARLLIAGQHPD